MSVPSSIFCVQCRQQTTERGAKYFPFCSERCKLIDLGKWSAEEYKVSVPITSSAEIDGLDELDQRESETGADEARDLEE